MPSYPLARDWNQRKPAYDFLIVGSGYGGAITAARIASADLHPKPSVCILERGREWPVGSFPESELEWVSELRSSANPLGLYEILGYDDIYVLKGNGLGGGSLVNANVAIVPDEDTFQLDGWPRQLNLAELMPYYRRAREVLGAKPHPRASQLPKVQALDRRAAQLGLRAEPLDITVNFDLDGENEFGAKQSKCIDCGDCVTGCNVGAKNTLYMNYLPMAVNAGAEIYTQTKVEWIEKIPDGWRVHGTRVVTAFSKHRFTLEAANVILAAGSINSTEILMRSANLHGLSVSPMLGTRFGGNGDFFGLAYNGDAPAQVLGFGNRRQGPGTDAPPGPTIVAAIRYHLDKDPAKRFTIEDLSFARAYVTAAQRAFALLRGEDTDAGDEPREAERVARDFFGTEPYHRDGALNHTMLYLCMGIDDRGGYFRWERPVTERDGRVRVLWPGAGRQPLFSLINEEIRRHARAGGASFLANPLWAFLEARRLITAHPLGGCPMGEDYASGAVDQFGRVFAADGSVHHGLFVADGAAIPSAIGVNPFLTISAIAERVAEKKIRDMQGDAYPSPPLSVGFAALNPIDAVGKSEDELDRIFDCAHTLDIELTVNQGGRRVDPLSRQVENDEFWKGFFPSGHILNAMSSALHAGFRKEFHKQGRSFVGITSDSDGLLRVRNTIERIDLREQRGDLKPGRYLLLRYTDAPWQGFYDVLKVINPNLIIGRVYLGDFPNGSRQFTFPMTRRYGFAQMTVADHRWLWERGAVPTAADLEGAWCMDVVSNANHARSVAHLSFQNQPGGRLESRFQLLGLMEGLIVPRFTAEHFELRDFTPFRDEIRRVDDQLLIGKWVLDLPEGLPAPLTSLGIFHAENTREARRFGFYYLLTRATRMPEPALLAPFLESALPRGVGLSFDEELEGWYFPGIRTPAPGRDGDLTIAARIPSSGTPAGASSFRVRAAMTIADLNDFIDGVEHEARVSGSVVFGSWMNHGPSTFELDRHKSFFRYLYVNPQTREAEMQYHLEFAQNDGKRFTIEGRKYMQKDKPAGPDAAREVLEDYTTCYAHLFDGAGAEIGTGLLKLRTFEDVLAAGNLAAFLRSFRVTGTADPHTQLLAQMRFHAFTGRFVQREYDALALPARTGG